MLAQQWHAEHEDELACADVAAGSKYLISTRVKGLLAEAHSVEIKLPTRDEALHILMATAGVVHEHAHDKSQPPIIPAGAQAVVDHCARLPLALGIAARLVHSLGLSAEPSWEGLVDILKEELRQSTSGGIEESCIRATLRSLKGSEAEKEATKSVLLLMAIVPEDTALPLEAMQIMYDATNESKGSTPLIKIRQYLRVLIDRSLILGSIDRPSVHDLVLDFCIAQVGLQRCLPAFLPIYTTASSNQVTKM